MRKRLRKKKIKQVVELAAEWYIEHRDEIHQNRKKSLPPEMTYPAEVVYIVKDGL